jgi:hypothetical protein
MDTKKYLADYKNWRKEDFIRAREANKLGEDNISEKYYEFGEYGKSEFEAQVKHMNWENRSYSYFESSHAEQREYIVDAIKKLPGHLREEASKAIEELRMRPQNSNSYKGNSLNSEIEIKDYKITVLGDGSIKIKGKSIKNEIILGKVSYEIFGVKTFKNWAVDYMVNLEQNRLWALPDFFKLGIEEKEFPKENVIFYCIAEKCYICENKLLIEGSFGNSECSKYGCPRKVIIEYKFYENEIEFCAYLYNKDASRLPEAIWISHLTENNGLEDVKLMKLGETVSPFEVVECGNRNYHSIKEVNFRVNNSKISITPLDSTLLSIGERRLYNFEQNYSDLKGGLHFNLYNNLWGTNFKMWYEEDIISRFKINIK